MLTSCPQRLAFAICLCRGLAVDGRRYVGAVHRALGRTCGPCGGSTKCARGLVSGLPHRVCRALRSREPLRRPTPWLLGFQPLPASKPRRTPQYPGCGEKEGSILAPSRPAGETRQPLTTFSPSLLAVGPPGGEAACSCFSYLLHCIQSWVFCSRDVLGPLFWTPDTSKGVLNCG